MEFHEDTSLTTTEETKLAELESVIEHGLQTFVDVGTALLEIRDSRLYRKEYSTFEEYCRGKWGMSKRYANYQIEAARTIGNLGTIVPTLPATESQARPLTSLPPEVQAEAWQRAVETAPEGRVTAAHVQSVADTYREQPEIIEKRPVSYHISDDSYDWYTPAEYIEAARGVMGSIDVDPASSYSANQVVLADKYYTKEDDGIIQPWYGNVWLNPPYNMPLIEQFVDKAIELYKNGTIDSAIVLTNNSTDTGWFHKLIQYPVCFTKGRIQFWNGDERLATRQGQAIFYLGNNMDLFATVFSVFGVVLRRYDNP